MCAMPSIPAGTGEHPISFVVLATRDLDSSRAFYAKMFGWSMMPLSAELAAGTGPAGPGMALRANQPEGSQTCVPFIGVASVDAMLERVSAAGGSTERAPWTIPVLGKLARIKDPSGTVYGLFESMGVPPQPKIPMPFGDNPKPPPGAICSLEMHASGSDGAAKFFGDVFGWGTLATMPGYLGFDPGAGVSGVFQTHTPAVRGMAYVWSSDVKASLAVITASGGVPRGEAMSMPGMGTFGYFTDPSGTAMGLIGP